jgi:hypothetical protein
MLILLLASLGQLTPLVAQTNPATVSRPVPTSQSSLVPDPQPAQPGLVVRIQFNGPLTAMGHGSARQLMGDRKATLDPNITSLEIIHSGLNPIVTPAGPTNEQQFFVAIHLNAAGTEAVNQIIAASKSERGPLDSSPSDPHLFFNNRGVSFRIIPDPDKHTSELRAVLTTTQLLTVAAAIHRDWNLPASQSPFHAWLADPASPPVPRSRTP